MYCVIDIGSNAIRLVVYRVENNTIKPIIFINFFVDTTTNEF